MSQIPPSITITVHDFLDLAFRRKWFFIIPFVLIASLSFIAAYTKPAVYKSVALIVVEEELVRNPFVSGLAIPTSVQQKLNTLMQKILSQSHLEKVVNELYLEKRMPKMPEKEMIINLIKSNINTTFRSGSVIEMGFEGPDPLVCKEILETLVDTLVKESLKVEDTQTQRGIEFLNGQIEFYRKKLEDSERALSEYKKNNMKDLSVQTTEAIRGTIGFPSGVNINVSRVMGFEMQLIDIRLELDQLLKEKEGLEAQLTKEQKVVVSQTVRSADPVTRELSNQLVELQVKMNNLLVDSSSDHPEVLRLQKKIDNITEMLQKRSNDRVEEETYSLNPVRIELQKRYNDINVKIDSLRTKEKTLSILTSKFNEKIERLPDQEREFAKLNRDYGINASMYSMLRDKLETAQITKRLETNEEGARFKLIDPPNLPTKPIKPKRMRILVLGIAVGLMIGVGCVVGVQYMDKSFKTEKGLGAIIGVPVLSSIPKMLLEQEDQIRKAKQKFTIILLGCCVLLSVILVLVKYAVKLKI